MTQISKIEIKLICQPFNSRERYSTFVHLRGNGEIEIVRYSLADRKIISKQQGLLSKTELQEILRQVNSTGFQEALKRKRFDNDEGMVEEGDRFYLLLPATEQEVGGLEHKSPLVVHRVISLLLSRKDNLKQIKSTQAYVYCLPIEAKRYELLRSEGKIRFVQMQELSAGLDFLVANTINQALMFHSLTQAQHKKLLSFASHGSDIFIIMSGKGYQLRLFLPEEK